MPPSSTISATVFIGEYLFERFLTNEKAVDSKGCEAGVANSELTHRSLLKIAQMAGRPSLQ